MKADRTRHPHQAQSWQKIIARYQKPDLGRSGWQMLNTLIPYAVLWYAMARSLDVSYWLTLVLAVPTAGFFIRIFILFHDCCHMSFFKARRANEIMGIIAGVLTFTPYYLWRHQHAVHHATSGDLDRRGVGDIKTLTIEEYLALSPWQRVKYRLYRHPLVLLVVGPVFLFLIGYRFVRTVASKRERRSVYWTNLAILGVVLLTSAFFGVKTYLLVQLPIAVIGCTFGVWLFYVQHQFEGVRWERHEEWTYLSGALEGSSYYRLPKVLQWFTGSIGLHHVHHLGPRVPNYHLQKCHDENAMFHETPTIGFWVSLTSLRFRLWDEAQRRLVGFRALRGYIR